MATFLKGWMAAIGGLLALVLGRRNAGSIRTDSDSGADADGHVQATDITARANEAVSRELLLEERDAFDDARRGFITADDPLITRTATGEIIWDRSSYDFIQGDAPRTVNPSLWRQAKLNNIHGLFKVTDGIYQVRGYDLANMSVIEGQSGRILVDPLTTIETAAGALKLVNRELGQRAIAAIILTHSHIDHFGGIKGVTSTEDIHSRNVRLVAPQNFTEEAISENVVGGIVMGRRACYMYGSNLGHTVRGHVDSGLGKGPALGNVSMIAPTETVDHTGQTMDIDGVKFEFQYVPDSEAPAELTFFLPQFKAYCGAEIVSHNMHNLYTLRGAKVRDALLWSTYIDEAIELYGGRAEVTFMCHHWPVWGAVRVVDYLKKQRDTYRYLHDQTLRMASAGMTPSEIAESMVLPKVLRQSFPNRGYYGTAKHNARAVYQFYFGWFDGNPANLDPLPPEDEGKRYVEALGGSDLVLARAQASYHKGDYRWAATLLNHLVFANPGNGNAKNLLASVYDQLGYQAESGPWRDVYLTGAQELRRGVPIADSLARTQDILNSIRLDQFFAAMATRLNGPKADGKEMTINFVFKDVGKTVVVRLENAVLHYGIKAADPGADSTVTLTRPFWIKLATKQMSLKALTFSNEFHIEGSRSKLVSLFSMLDEPDRSFAIITP
jgi:alkyl sulfatase BDS1-like metallo-beta-lactamase superfamily hydrolase